MRCEVHFSSCWAYLVGFKLIYHPSPQWRIPHDERVNTEYIISQHFLKHFIVIIGWKRDPKNEQKYEIPANKSEVTISIHLRNPTTHLPAPQTATRKTDRMQGEWKKKVKLWASRPKPDGQINIEGPQLGSSEGWDWARNSNVAHPNASTLDKSNASNSREFVPTQKKIAE